jgi:hypothetical protein
MCCDVTLPLDVIVCNYQGINVLKLRKMIFIFYFCIAIEKGRYELVYIKDIDHNQR